MTTRAQTLRKAARQGSLNEGAQAQSTAQGASASTEIQSRANGSGNGSISAVQAQDGAGRRDGRPAPHGRSRRAYCSCRQPDDGTPMILCSECKEWCVARPICDDVCSAHPSRPLSHNRYHFRCLGLSEREAEDIREFRYLMPLIFVANDLFSSSCLTRCLVATIHCPWEHPTHTTSVTGAELYICPSCHEKTGLRSVSEYFQPLQFTLNAFSLRDPPPPPPPTTSCRTTYVTHAIPRCCRVRARQYDVSFCNAFRLAAASAAAPRLLPVVQRVEVL